jgi:hypothetical protein
MSGKTLSALAAVLLASAATGLAFAADDSNRGDRDHASSIDNPNHCKVVERKPGEDNGNLSTSVTAGNGHVSAHSSGGHGVTVHSGNGSVSSSVSTTGSGNGTTTVTTSNGDCIIYVNPGEKKED